MSTEAAREYLAFGPENEPPKLTDTAPVLKLDFGCGMAPEEGHEGVDIRPGCGKHLVNLFQFPFSWQDSSVAEINANHFVEHIPARDVDTRDNCDPAFVGRDYFLAFFDECYRILVPGGKMIVKVPCSRSDRAFQDPTHRRFINQYTFSYLNAKMRTELGVSHYQVSCDFDSVVVPIGPSEFALYCDEVRANRFNSHWNAVLDIHATLTSKKT